MQRTSLNRSLRYSKRLKPISERYVDNETDIEAFMVINTFCEKWHLEKPT